MRFENDRGSSPLARGTREVERWRTGVDRFIPACAGNSIQSIDQKRRQPVHPRLRGELSMKLGRRVQENGSSPLARGTLHQFPHGVRCQRFIPACAGNSNLSRSSTNCCPWFIPACAGNSSESLHFSISSDGSSPLARGTHEVDDQL